MPPEEISEEADKSEAPASVPVAAPPPAPVALPPPPPPPGIGAGPPKKSVVKSSVPLSACHITAPLNAFQAKSTFWNDTDDEKLMKKIDWTKFDEAFKHVKKESKISEQNTSSAPKDIFVLDPGRFA